MNLFSRVLILSIGAVIAGQVFAHQPIANVESPTLTLVTPAISNMITSDPSFAELKELNCRLEGQPVHLSNTPGQSGLFVTTADACGWGAALAPIWIVVIASGVPRIVLDTGGYYLATYDRARHGYFDISINGGTARGPEVSSYRYDGTSYRRVK